jgi:hypothetical protein
MMLGCLLPFNEATCPEAMIFFEGWTAMLKAIYSETQ